jgi:KaiC/GvpD/RAD55 family RecA-like ATPase
VAEGPRILDGQWALPATYRQGGHARVYRATDLEGVIDGVLAVKVIPPAIAGDQRLAIQVFQREQDSLARLQHPNIVKLLSGGRDPDSGERYFVFPWLERDLADVLRERPVEGWDDLWSRFGDIKPSNVLVDADGRPMISDFGIAKVLSQIAPGATLRDQVTRPYAPPEYDDGQHTAGRDVHAFGVLCVTVIAGIDPLQGYEDDRYRAVRDALDQLDVPAAVHELLSTCVDSDPECRPVNAVVLRERLREAGVARRKAAPQRLEVEHPVCSLKLTTKATSVLMDYLDLHADLQIEAAIIDNLAEESALVPFPSRTFEDGSSTDGHFYLVGTELRLHVTIERTARDRLVVLNGWPAESSLLERERDRGWRPPCTFVLTAPADRVAAQDLINQLELGVSEHQAEERLRRMQDQRERPLKVWRAMLAALRSGDREREAPLRYRDVRETPVGIQFQLDLEPSEDLVGELRLVDCLDRGRLAGEIVAVGADTLTLRPTTGRFEALPNKGELRIDQRAARAARRRQEQALDALQYGRALRPELRDLLLDPSLARKPEPVQPARWHQRRLDDPKRNAVAAALGTDDILLIEGPPGTGKTTFITEVVLQYLERHPNDRILVSSQTNAALDNVLERLAVQEPRLRLLRVARREDDRVAEAVEPFRLERQIEAWRGEVIASGRQWLAEWAHDRGISASNIEIAIRLDELAAERDALTRLNDELADADRRLAVLRDQQGEPGDTDADLDEGTLAERRPDIVDELTAARLAADEVTERLVELGVARRAAELREVTAIDLRQRARATVAAEGGPVDECRKLIDLLGDWHGRFGRGPQFHAAALLRSQVVAATCIGYAGVRGSETIEFDLCIVDEASKATATELLVPMTRARRWIVVGDHRQLPPFIDEALERPDVLQDHQLSSNDVRETLFDRLRAQLPRECVRPLSLQHRMVPEIGDLISHCFYGDALDSAPRPPLGFVGLVCGKPVSWQSTAGSKQRFEQKVGTTLTNRYEARCVERLLERLEFAAKSARRKLTTVAVLSGYAGQRDLIDRQIASERRNWKHLSVSCSTIDAFQGREADVAIYSVTRSNRDGRIGFLREKRRLNVGLSRGREALILVGDHVGVAAAAGENPFLDVLEYSEDHPDACALMEIKP